MSPAQQDLLHVLAREHRDHGVLIHQLIDRIDGLAMRNRRRQFGSLVLHLGLHLTAERLLIHPLTRRGSGDGDELARLRELEINSLCDRIRSAGGDLDRGEDVAPGLTSVSGSFAAHADREELEMYSHVRHLVDPRDLRQLGRIHATLQQRLLARYGREGDDANEPWSDPHLFDALEGWYREALDPERGPPTPQAGPDPAADG